MFFFILLTFRLKNIYSFGLLRKIDKTIDFSQVMWTKQHNQSIYRALDNVLIKLSKFKYADNEAKLHNSRQFISSILYLYLIGIGFCLFTFAVEYLINFILKKCRKP